MYNINRKSEAFAWLYKILRKIQKKSSFYLISWLRSRALRANTLKGGTDSCCFLTRRQTDLGLTSFGNTHITYA
jgi:hypothetical protein